jgi:UDP-4-amino-4,6-dideoxy-N-acetyl-beta-L-altrosamine N-acetyltransferase
MTDPGCIRPMTREDLPQVLAWRNHPLVRQHMFTRHEISMDEHCTWFDRVSADPSRRVLLVVSADGPFGCVQFSQVAPGEVATWGFYVRPQAPRGSGMRLGKLALDHAFGALRLYKVCGQALESNTASQAFHLKLGFTQEGVRLEPFPGKDGTQAVICFGLQAACWKGLEQARKGSHEFH